jgi:hypothetical protein
MELAAPGLVGEQPKSFPVSSLSPGGVDKGVGHSPKLIRPSSDVTLIETQLQLDSNAETMPEAAGAVAAGAVADRLLGPREQQQLAIILVGLPAQGNTFTAAKLTRYFCGLGHDTKHFNVGKYRRLKLGSSQVSVSSMLLKKPGFSQLRTWESCVVCKNGKSKWQI